MILIFGFGYVGRHFAASLPDGVDIYATSRRRSSCEGRVKIVDFTKKEVEPLLSQAEYIIDTTPPSGGNSPVISMFGRSIERYCRQLKWLCYLSTTGVYGNLDGAWASEETPLRATNERSRARIATEQAWQILAIQCKVPLAILRLSGMYGPGRSQLERLKSGSARNIYKPGHYFSRIHVADITTCLQLAMQKRAIGVYNLADDEPAPSYKVLEYAASKAGMAAPARVSLADSGASSMAKEFYADSKRVSNNKVKNQLGLKLKYPSYRDFY